MPNQYPNGIGAPVGDSLVTCSPLTTSGSVWYVDSETGVDNASPAGRNREKPLATLQQAITNASAGDIISCLAGHTQSVSSAINISKTLTIVGEGSVAGVPAVSFSGTGAAVVFSVGAVSCEIRNIMFAASTGGSAQPRIDVVSVDCLVDGCYFECSALDNNAAIRIVSGAHGTRIRNTTILSTSISSASQPATGILITGAVDDLALEGVVLDAGTVGFSNFYALDGNGAAVTRLVGQDISLLRGADIRLDPATTGRLNIQTATGGSRVEW